MSDKRDFLNKIVKIVTEFSAPVLLRFCDDLERFGTNFSGRNLESLFHSVNQPQLRQVLSTLLDDCRNKFPEITPCDLAWILRAASASDEYHRKFQAFEFVWTGPAPEDSTLRRTDQALIDLIQTAKKSLIIVTFVAYKIPTISNALVRAGERGVSISLILESAEQSEDKVEFSAIKAFGDKIANKAKIYYWPLEQRKINRDGHHGSLHVKCAIADSKMLLLSSANLTEFALNLNMEMGLLIRGGELPVKANNHFNDLISNGVLEKIC